MRRTLYKCDFCNMTSTRWWNIRRHTERKHARLLANLNFQPRNKISNVPQNFQMNHSNFELPNYYLDNTDSNHSSYDGMRTSAFASYNKQNSILNEIMPKIEQLDRFGLFKLRLFVLDLISKRSRL